MTKSKSIIFLVLASKGYTEIEWLMPYIAGLSKRGFHMDVLFANRPRSDRTKIIVEWASEYATCIFIEDFDPLGQFFNLLAKIRNQKGFISKLVRPYTDFNHRLGMKIGLSQWRWNQLKIKMLERTRKSQVCFIADQYNLGAEFTITRLINETIFDSGNPILWQKVDVDEITEENIISRQKEFHIVHSKTQKIEAESWKRNAVITGAQRYTKDWLNEIGKCFDSHFTGDFGPLSQNRQTALVIMKNEYSVVWKDADFFAETTKMIEQLIDENNFLIVKPHPSQNIDLLTKILQQFPQDSYIVDNRPLAYLANKVDKCFSQISTGSLDPIALGKDVKVYSPRINNDGINDEHDSNQLDRKLKVIKEISLWTMSDQKSDEAAFEQQFRSDISWEDGINICEKLVLSLIAPKSCTKNSFNG